MRTRTQTPSIVALHRQKICHSRTKMRWPPQMLLGSLMRIVIKSQELKFCEYIDDCTDCVRFINVTETSRRRPFLSRFWTRLAMVDQPQVRTMLMRYPGRRRLTLPVLEPTWRNRTLQVRIFHYSWHCRPLFVDLT